MEEVALRATRAQLKLLNPPHTNHQEELKNTTPNASAEEQSKLSI
jgi:hypothetical protein